MKQYCVATTIITTRRRLEGSIAKLYRKWVKGTGCLNSKEIRGLFFSSSNIVIRSLYA
jgi:hypothetical protein